MSQADDLRAKGSELFTQQHPRLGRGTREGGEPIGEVAYGDGRILRIEYLPPRRHPDRGMIALRVWGTYPSGEFYPTTLGMFLPARLLPHFAHLTAKALDRELQQQSGPGPTTPSPALPTGGNGTNTEETER